MIKLTILKEDGSPYWTEHFNDLASGEQWLAEEKTRTYWNPKYTSSFADITPAPRVLTYTELRVRAYPPISEYLDGVVKGDEAQVDAYIAACLAVKAKYPKPE